MTIIRKEPNPSGAYSPPQLWNSDTPPETHAIIPDTLDMSTFYEYNGFVVLTVESVDGIDTVTAYTPNVEAWEAWKASLPEPESTPIEPTMEERITDLEEQLAESDAVALALYEAQVEQETVIAEHDEAILGIYEMIGG